MEINEDQNQNEQQPIAYPPKPILIENKQNWIRRSLISLAIYAFLFLTLFQGNFTYISAVLVTLLIHELGHFFAMKYYHYSDVKMFVIPLLGAYVTGKKPVLSQKQMTVIILAGPLPGILIGVTLLLANAFYPNERLNMLGNIFFIFNLFNLLPFLPLDGGRILETLFIKESHVIRIVFTIISILALLILSLIFGSIFFLILPVTMILSLVMEIKNEKIRDYLRQERINYYYDYNDLPDKIYWTIRDCILMAFSSRYKGVEPGHYQYSMAENVIIQHISSILRTPYKLDIGLFGKILIVLLYAGIIIGSFVFLFYKFVLDKL